MHIPSFDSPINKILYQETKVLVHSYFLKTNEFTMFSFDYCRETNFIKKPKCLSTHISWRQLNLQCFLLIIAEKPILSRNQSACPIIFAEDKWIHIVFFWLLQRWMCAQGHSVFWMAWQCDIYSWHLWIPLPYQGPQVRWYWWHIERLLSPFLRVQGNKAFHYKNSDRKRTFDMPN